MALYGAWSQGLRGTAPVSVLLPAWAVAIFCVVLVLHPLVDLVVWQRLAALCTFRLDLWAGGGRHGLGRARPFLAL